jgi:hypothetical protein
LTAWTTVRIHGGLGNQLFQYAAGRGLADRTGTKLRLDACYFGVEKLRNYELDNFKIRAAVVHEPAESARYMGHNDIEDGWIRGRYGAEPVREPHYHYSDILNRAQPNSFITGYWQCERYFAGSEQAVRAELTPRRLSRAARAIRRRIERADESVAVHVRRGDIATDPALLALVGNTSVEYYQRAAALIGERRADPHFFVFSDDPAWCRANLELPGKMEIVSGETLVSDDLALISYCGDAVIANSSYSWWGAWLGETPDSIIIAPEQWYDELTHDTSDVRPERWHTL